LDKFPEKQKVFLQRQRLAPAYLASAQYWFDPLADELSARQQSAGRPLLVAVNGSQGSGKSTLCAYLEMTIATRHQLNVLTLSLDDFYFPRAQRLEISREVHPLLATRGVPGTHDMALLQSTLDALMSLESRGPINIVRFDKATDDRTPQPEQCSDAVDIILLEGWCLGAHPQPVEELIQPVNTLEASEDTDGIWRKYVNGVLARDFLPLYRRVDQWIMLQAPDFNCVFRWRLEQEQKLATRQLGNRPIRMMDEQQLQRFIQFYERITRLCLTQLPSWVDYLFILDESRRIGRQQ
jgi:D-glycerate 3-kinase